MNEYVTLKHLANELGLDKSNLQKYVVKHGISPFKVRTNDSGRQLTLAITASEAETVRESRQAEGFSGLITPILNNDGYFYIIQLVPELAPNRVKLGYTNDILARLNAHRTSAPTATLIKYWQCRRSWEIAAIDSVTRCECQLISNEVFECDNLAILIERADQFFTIMLG